MRMTACGQPRRGTLNGRRQLSATADAAPERSLVPKPASLTGRAAHAMGGQQNRGMPTRTVLPHPTPDRRTGGV
jgi:hypothetical protein